MWKNILLFLSLSGLVGHHASPITKLYHFVDQKMTWTDAQRHCREHFDDLAAVVNPEELKQLQESMIGSDNDDDRMWIGLYDDITRWSNYNLTYIMGQHYGNWAPGEPNFGAAEETCTKIHQSTGQWMDVQCSNPNKVQRAKTSTFKLKISSEANLMDPEVQHQFVEQLSAKLAKEGVTGVKLCLVLKDGQEQRPQK
ncbi:unnamed protein product [Boreogadus saida]